MPPSEAERTLLAKLRAGQPVTALDHVPTIRTTEELAAFVGGLTGTGRMTDDLRIACLRQQQKIGGK